MTIAHSYNLLEIDVIIEQFMKDHEAGIKTIHYHYFHHDESISLRAICVELQDKLKSGCVSFFNKDYPIEELNPYLFYIVNDFIKNKAVPQIKKKTEYLCPGCLFLGKDNIIVNYNNEFDCDECKAELKQSVDPIKILLFRTFFKHNKNGYRCQDCHRFLPHPIEDIDTVSCPYFDCCFVGAWSALKRMRHPTTQSNLEILTLDSIKEDTNFSFKNSIVSPAQDQQTQLEVKEVIKNNVILLKEVIAYQNNNVPYNSSDFTVKHKCLVYQAYDNLLSEFPDEMVDYLLHTSRSGGFQSKIFQEYIRLLEISFPFVFKKNGKQYQVESLLDDNLNLFDGISTFSAIVTDKLEIKNGTEEFYIGGRKASYTKPYYIGKLLNIINQKTKFSLINNVTEYSFSKIKLQDIVPGTEVIVTHLRIPPHYQMGGMVYVNRIRKKIVERAKLILNKKDGDEDF